MAQPKITTEGQLADELAKDNTFNTLPEEEQQAVYQNLVSQLPGQQERQPFGSAISKFIFPTVGAAGLSLAASGPAAVAGAELGSALMPGPGTFIGAGLGAALPPFIGAVAGSRLRERIQAALSGEAPPPISSTIASAVPYLAYGAGEGAAQIGLQTGRAALEARAPQLASLVSELPIVRNLAIPGTFANKVAQAIGGGFTSNVIQAPPTGPDDVQARLRQGILGAMVAAATTGALGAIGRFIQLAQGNREQIGDLKAQIDEVRANKTQAVVQGKNDMAATLSKTEAELVAHQEVLQKEFELSTYNQAKEIRQNAPELIGNMNQRIWGPVDELVEKTGQAHMQVPLTKVLGLARETYGSESQEYNAIVKALGKNVDMDVRTAGLFDKLQANIEETAEGLRTGRLIGNDAATAIANIGEWTKARDQIMSNATRGNELSVKQLISAAQTVGATGAHAPGTRPGPTSVFAGNAKQVIYGVVEDVLKASPDEGIQRLAGVLGRARSDWRESIPFRNFLYEYFQPSAPQDTPIQKGAKLLQDLVTGNADLDQQNLSAQLLAEYQHPINQRIGRVAEELQAVKQSLPIEKAFAQTQSDIEGERIASSFDHTLHELRQKLAQAQEAKRFPGYIARRIAWLTLGYPLYRAIRTSK